MSDSRLPFIRVFPARYGGVGHGLHPKTKNLLCGRDFPFSIDYDDSLTLTDCKICVSRARKLITQGIVEIDNRPKTTCWMVQLIPPHEVRI